MASDHAGLPTSGPVEFDLDGELFTLPDLDTRTWLGALVLDQPGCWMTLLPLRLDSDGPTRLLTRLLNADDPFDLDDVENVATNVLTRPLGMDFWAATRLAQIVYANWLAFDGWCWTRGMSPLTQPIARVLAACWSWRSSMCQKNSEVVRLEHQIWAGPPETTALGRSRVDRIPTWAADGREEAAFDQFIAMMGGRGG